jgi:hypothetical protein
MTAAVDAGALLQVVWASLLAGIGITTVFSVVIFASARAGEAGRAGRGSAALGFGALAVVAVIGFAVGIVLGVDVMLSKD